MSDRGRVYLANYFRASQETIGRAASDAQFCATVLAVAEAIAQSLAEGGKLLIAGNGGSAADAQHVAGEFLSRFKRERDPLPALALTTDTSVLTAVGNDFGFDQVFARQVRGLGRRGDVLLAISTSGRSPNILSALNAARAAGLKTIGLTGRTGGDMHALCDLCLCVPSDDTPLIQQVHLIAAHAICALVEDRLFG